MRILVIKMSSLGDLFHALPAVHCVKSGLGCTVDWVCQSEYVDVVSCFTEVDNVIPFDRRHALRSMRDLRTRFKSSEYDYVIDMQGLLKSALVGRFAVGKQRIGPSFYREHANIFYDSVAGEKNKDRHAVDENFDIVRHLGLTVTRAEFPVKFPDYPVHVALPLVGISAFSRWPTKNWPIESFAEVARGMAARFAANIFLFGAEADRPECEKLAELIGDRVTNTAGKLSLVEMCSLVSRMSLFVTNDSGPMHVAAATGVPVVAMMGPTEVRRTGPYCDVKKVFTADVPCRPCFERKCRLGTTECMTGISAEEVLEASLAMLG